MSVKKEEVYRTLEKIVQFEQNRNPHLTLSQVKQLVFKRIKETRKNLNLSTKEEESIVYGTCKLPKLVAYRKTGVFRRKRRRVRSSNRDINKSNFQISHVIFATNTTINKDDKNEIYLEFLLKQCSYNKMQIVLTREKITEIYKISIKEKDCCSSKILITYIRNKKNTRKVREFHFGLEICRDFLVRGTRKNDAEFSSYGKFDRAVIDFVNNVTITFGSEDFMNSFSKKHLVEIYDKEEEEIVIDELDIFCGEVLSADKLFHIISGNSISNYLKDESVTLDNITGETDKFPGLDKIVGFIKNYEQEKVKEGYMQKNSCHFAVKLMHFFLHTKISM